MTLLRDRAWKLKYTPDEGNLAYLLYEPMVASAARYDRLTGYFSASALAVAARGVEALVRNDGRMSLVVGCTLDAPEIDAIERGATLRAEVERHLGAVPLQPLDQPMADALELLAWLVAQGRLEIKVAVPCDVHRRPIPADGIFHEKSGIVEDRSGDRVAFTGSLNETHAGWTGNWDSLHVFTSWRDPDRVQQEEANFSRIWSDRANRVTTLDVPAAVREDLLRFLPKHDRPARLPTLEVPPELLPEPAPAPEPDSVSPLDLRQAVWDFIAMAPRLPGGGCRAGEATAPVKPWPHQVRAFHRLYDNWPPKLLIADEVGLGKTVQAGLLLRQAWLAGRARRILILAPKAVCGQWQIELREKFNLNWPIYDGQKLAWFRSPAMEGRHERAASREEWHREPVVIASSHLVRRADRQRELLDAEWDLVILDEAHHARRRGAGSANEGGPNELLRLMRGLKERTQGLVLLTATPMQVHPVEIFDLLSLLGLPPEWSEPAFLGFFKEALQDSPSHEEFDRLAAMFRAVERTYGKVEPPEVQRLGLSGLKSNKVLRALRDQAGIPRRQLETDERRTALRLMRLHTPVNRLVSRHTRELLRRNFKAGKLTTPIADRRVEDRFIDLSPDERAVYDAVEEYISSTYKRAAVNKRSAVGFIMTIYRRRLASSFFALRQTLEGRAARSHAQASSDADFEEALDYGEQPDPEEMEREASALEERADIERLLAMIRRLAPDSKLQCLRSTIAELGAAGYPQVMVFTQFADTMDFLRGEIGPERTMCFSGRGGEVASADGTWHTIKRDDVKRRFRDGEADILLCTDAAAEGLNFQFCGALINYDMPWNPMRVEQRIGRIDRLGQDHPDIRIVNLHYAETVEADVYCALRQRIGLFERVVGSLQPILARLPTLISERVLEGRSSGTDARQDAVNELEREAARVSESGFDIDAVTDDDWSEPPRPASPLTMADLDRVIGRVELVPPGMEVSPLHPGEYMFRQPGMQRSIRVATDPAYYEQHADTVELWSPGNPTFPVIAADPERPVSAATLGDLLARAEPKRSDTGRR